jgi:transposase
MMGCRTGSQDRLFYSFNLDEHIPQNHLLRGIERCLDLGELRQHLADYYSHTGRPSIDPELMIRMLIVGYCYGIRSERRLCEEVHLNLAYRCSVALAWKMPCPITPPSPRIAMGASVPAGPSAGCLTKSSAVA